ncbi:glycoside hydrolase family 108 protein [Burkholderia sp. DN3021]|uniref:glycoside hydrolase family 108 protein n=1 Tax=Burkholderia sp. DN3021 TaxID=3410137 RepID=UPI003C7BA6B4
MKTMSKIEALIGCEGGFSDDPNDRGNWYLGKCEGTMWGVTAAQARTSGYTGPMQALPRAMAVAIYEARYWRGPRFDELEAISSRLAEKLFDIGVNAGPVTGVKFLQRALNVLNQNEKTFPDISTDGRVGPMTIAALKAFLQVRGAEGHGVLLGMIAAQQSVFYIELAERRPENETFEYGWQLNRALGV